MCMFCETNKNNNINNLNIYMHDEIMFVKTNEMNDPALIQQAYSCHKINSSKRFAIALMEI